MFGAYKDHTIKTFDDRVKERAYYLWLNESGNALDNYYKALNKEREIEKREEVWPLMRMPRTIFELCSRRQLELVCDGPSCRNWYLN